uniref:Chemosensory protein n=1 Tax=Rhyparobia maderae TaxID=36963 RepID=Q8MTC3_RHYMA|nr:chemosensory protein [Rhyparobia maderae]
MKTVAVVCLLLVAVAFSQAARLRREDKPSYTTKYDNIDLDEILGSKRLLNNYFNCLLDKGPCTPDGKELRDHIPDALETGCDKCSDKQKNGTRRVLKFLIDNEPDRYKELENKFDPEGTYRKKYEKEAKEYLS